MSRRPDDLRRDVDGVGMPDRCRVEPVGVVTGQGALPCRLFQRGAVVGRGADRVDVRFGTESRVVRVRPHVLRDQCGGFVMDTPDVPDQPRPGRANELTITVTCSAPGARGFCNLRIMKVGGEITLDPHVAGGCVARLGRDRRDCGVRRVRAVAGMTGQDCPAEVSS